METVEELSKPAGKECPRIVSAVLKALRGEDEPAEVIEQMRAHVASCQACAARLSRLVRLAQSIAADLDKAGVALTEVQLEANPQSRRKFRRLPTNEAVNLVFEDGSVTLARMIEVSAKGAKIESPDELNRDDQFTLNRGRRSTQVAVRHCSRQGELYIIGVEYMRNAVRA